MKRWLPAATMALILGGPAGAALPSARGQAVAALRHDLTEAERVLSAGRIDEAQELYEAAVRRAEQISGESLLMARATDGLADARRVAGRAREAEELYLRAVPLWIALLGERQPRLAVTLHNLAAVLVVQGRAPEALPHLRRALAIWETTSGPDSPEAAAERQWIERVARSADQLPAPPRAEGR
jgi:tetratricopeptide (TPR) repeat protein